MRRSSNGYPVRPKRINRPEHVQLAIHKLAGTGVSFISIKDISEKGVTSTELKYKDHGQLTVVNLPH